MQKRFYGITLKQIPGMKQNPPALKLFYKRTENVDNLRNLVQHLNNEIDNLAESELPVWGVLNWFHYTNPEQRIGYSRGVARTRPINCGRP